LNLFDRQSPEAMPLEGGNMKWFLCFALIATLVAVPAFSLTFDVKVRAHDSLKLTPIQAGLTYYIFEGGDKVLPFSEDYAIWLDNYKKTVDGDKVSVSFEMRLTPAAFIKEEAALSTVQVAFDYSLKQAEETGKNKDESPLKSTRLKLERFGKQTAYEAKIGGKAAAEKLPELLKMAGVEGKKPQSRGFALPKFNLGWLPTKR
jgi:hypothetical protein